VGFGEHRVGLGGLLGCIYGFCFFSLIFGGYLGLVWVVFAVFCGLRWVLVGFMFVVMVKKCKLWVLENIG